MSEDKLRHYQGVLSAIHTLEYPYTRSVGTVIGTFLAGLKEGRIIGCGRGSRELTGLSDEKVIGRPVRDVLGLDFAGGEDHVGTALEWGVRRLGKPVIVNAEGDLPAKAVADLFPAYDDDGGLLLVLTPSR